MLRSCTTLDPICLRTACGHVLLHAVVEGSLRSMEARHGLSVPVKCGRIDLDPLYWYLTIWMRLFFVFRFRSPPYNIGAPRWPFILGLQPRLCSSCHYSDSGTEVTETFTKLIPFTSISKTDVFFCQKVEFKAVEFKAITSWPKSLEFKWPKSVESVQFCNRFCNVRKINNL